MFRDTTNNLGACLALKNIIFKYRKKRVIYGLTKNKNKHYLTKEYFNMFSGNHENNGFTKLASLAGMVH